MFGVAAAPAALAGPLFSPFHAPFASLRKNRKGIIGIIVIMIISLHIGLFCRCWYLLNNTATTGPLPGVPMRPSTPHVYLLPMCNVCDHPNKAALPYRHQQAVWAALPSETAKAPNW